MKFLYLLIVLALTGCAAGGGVSGSNSGGSAGAAPTITALVIEVATLVPASTVTLAPTATSQAAAALAATATATPSAGGNPAAAPALVEQGFTDCALTPGWVGCDPSAQKVAGRLAFVDPAGVRVIVLDLESGASWQVASHPSRLAWSPDGKQLLLEHRSEGGTTYELYSAEGMAQQPPATDEELRWQPDGTLDSIMAVRSSVGDHALLEYSADQRWRLHVSGPEGSGPGQTFEIETQPTDQQYIPMGWIEGQNKILARRFSANNAALLTGAELITIETTSGAVQVLEPPVPVDVTAQFAAPPAGAAGLGGEMPAPIAITSIVAGGGRPVTTLALVDPITGKASYPITEDVQARNPIWSQDGTGVFFDAVPREPVGPYTGPGIYQFYPQTGKGERLTEPPQNMSDHWPHLTRDGQTMLFLRVGSLPSGELRMDVMAMRLSDRVTWVIAREIPVPGSQNVLVLPWSHYLDFGMK